MQREIRLTGKRGGLASLPRYLCSDPNALVNPVHRAPDEGAPRRRYLSCQGRALTHPLKGGWVGFGFFFFLGKRIQNTRQGTHPVFLKLYSFSSVIQMILLYVSEPNVLERYKQRLGWKEGVFSTLGPIKISKVSKHTTPLNPTEGN